MKLLCAVLAFIPAAAFAAGPFDGTWKMRLDATDFAPKPETFIIDGGMYHCASCAPKIDVKADGSDQPVTGHAYYDSVAVKPAGDSAYHIVRKKAGKVMYDATFTVSADRQTLTEKMLDQSGSQPVNLEVQFKRSAKAPAGAHAASGSWVYSKLVSMSDSGALVTYQETADGLKMSNPTGQSYDAKFTGADAPIVGDPAQTMVSLKKLRPNEIEETDKRDGKPVEVYDIKVSADGKKMIVSDHDLLNDRTDMYFLNKQP